MKVQLAMYLKTRGITRKDVKIIHVNDVKDSLEIKGRVVVVKDNEIVDYLKTSNLQRYIKTRDIVATLKERLVKDGTKTTNNV